MRRSILVILPVALLALLGAGAGVFWNGASTPAMAGDPIQGAKIFPACRVCHSLEPNRTVVGPSLAGLWGRRAGSLASYDNYSPALKASGVVWNERTLNAWLKSPAAFIPTTRMTFPGIRNDKVRADLIAYLKAATSPDSEGHRRTTGQATRVDGTGKIHPPQQWSMTLERSKDP